MSTEAWRANQHVSLNAGEGMCDASPSCNTLCNDASAITRKSKFAQLKLNLEMHCVSSEDTRLMSERVAAPSKAV